MLIGLGPHIPSLSAILVAMPPLLLSVTLSVLTVGFPERYEVWSLNRHGVHEVHLTVEVKLFDIFDEDTFWGTFYD